MRRVVQIENNVMIIGNNINISQPIPDNPSIAIRPTRALWAEYMINNSMGAARLKPIAVAVKLILATMVCIWRAIKLSDAPI